MLNNVFGSVSTENWDPDETFALALFLLGGLTQTDSIVLSTNLIINKSLDAVAFSMLGGDILYAHVLGGLALIYTAYTSDFTLNDLQRLEPAEQAIVVVGLALFVGSPFITEISNFVAGADWKKLVTLASEAGAYSIISEYR